MHLVVTLSTLFIVTLLLFSCSRSGLSDLSTQELVAKSDECMENIPSAPGKVTSCENIRKECKRRRIEESDFSC